MRCPIHGDKLRDTCRLCWLSIPAKARPSWNNETVRQDVIPLPCVSRGKELTSDERAEHQKSHQRTWYWCNNPDKPNGAIVCTCQGCNPSCSGYVAGEEE